MGGTASPRYVQLPQPVTRLIHMSATNTEQAQTRERTLIHVVARRRPDAFEVYLRSEIFEDYFRALATVPGRDPRLETHGSHRYYAPAELPAVEGCVLNDLESANLFRSGRTNISHLRAVGLSQGVTIRIPTVLSNSQLKNFTDQYYLAATRIYAEFIQPSEAELELTVRETVTPDPVVRNE